jgi:hypothetical protein
LNQGLFARESDGNKQILDDESQAVIQGRRGEHWLQKIAKNQTLVSLEKREGAGRRGSSREGAGRMENGAAGVPV